MRGAAHQGGRRARAWWVAAAFGIAGLVAVGLPSLGLAFTLKSLIMPGKVIAGHASIEDKCESCHESKETEKQSELCYACHKDIRGDLVSRSGFHGRDPDVVKAVAGAAAGAECSSCHTEHDGRDADITGLDPKTFEHMHTNFPLLGAHGGTACTGCHAAGKPYRATPQQCSGCHAADDPHEGALGASCEGCHSAAAWMQADVRSFEDAIRAYGRARQRRVRRLPSRSAVRGHTDAVRRVPSRRGQTRGAQRPRVRRLPQRYRVARELRSRYGGRFPLGG